MNLKFAYSFLIASLVALPFSLAAEYELPEVSLEGLELVEKDRRGEIYADPDVDWSVYTEIQLDRAFKYEVFWYT